MVWRWSRRRFICLSEPEIFVRSVFNELQLVLAGAMVASVQFSVDDSSPLLAYTPFPDTFGQANLTAGWNPYFVESGFVSAIGQTGVGQSQHITSRNGSSISLHWHGQSFC